MTINGTPGNDNLTGTSGDDTFNLSQGGDDTAQGLGGKDIFTFGDTFDANDSVDGGTGNDVLRLNGDYSAGVTFGATTLTNVELIQLSGGHSYNLTTDDANVAAGGAMTIDGHNLTASDSLTFNGLAEGDGHFRVIGGAGDDDITGSVGNDVITLDGGGTDVASGRSGADTFVMGAAFTAADQIDGGTGTDTVDLDGDYSGSHALDFGAITMTNIERLVLATGHSYTFVTAETTVAGGKTLKVDASALGSGNVLNFNGTPESNGFFDIIGGAGNDRIVGGNGGNGLTQTLGLGDTYDLSHGGNDIVTGGSGDDKFIMGGALTAHDALDGGGGSGGNIVFLDGDYSAGVTLAASTLANIQGMEMADGHDYVIVENNANVAAGKHFFVSAGTTGSHSATFDGSAETNGGFDFSAGTGTNVFTGGAQRDTFQSNGGLDTFHGGDGGDVFTMTPAFTAADNIDGGAGSDQLILKGGGTTVFTATTVTNVETLQLTRDAFNTSPQHYDITTNDANVAAGQTLLITLRPDQLGFNDSATFDGSAETDGHFKFLNSDSTDTFIGGALADTFDMTQRATGTVTGSGGADFIRAAQFNGRQITDGIHDTFVYNAVSDSTSVNYDTIAFFQANAHDILHTSGAGAATAGVDTAVTSGALSTATFDSDLATDVGAGQMAAHHAVLFTATTGTLAGQTFLVVDENGTAGYQAGADLVIDVTTGFSGTLTAANFA